MKIELQELVFLRLRQLLEDEMSEKYVLINKLYLQDAHIVVMTVLSGAHSSPRCCVNPASWLPLAASASFNQPHREKFALQNTG